MHEITVETVKAKLFLGTSKTKSNMMRVPEENLPSMLAFVYVTYQIHNKDTYKSLANLEPSN